MRMAHLHSVHQNKAAYHFCLILCMHSPLFVCSSALLLAPGEYALNPRHSHLNSLSS